MSKMKLRGVMAITGAIAAGACGGAPTDAASEEVSTQAQAAAVQPTLLARGNANGLSSSTGNLYWTTSVVIDGGDSTISTLWRASKDTVPGEEVSLYSRIDPIADGYFFGNLVWELEDTYYAYFTVSFIDNGVPTSQIQRVPLAGGEATVIAPSPAYIGTRDIASDGAYLYWADAGGIRKVSVNGTRSVVERSSAKAVSIGKVPVGVTTLATTTTTSHIGLDAEYVYFEQGTTIQRVPKTGGIPAQVVSTSKPVTAFYVDVPTGAIYLGETNGSVERDWSGGEGNPDSFQGATGDRTVVSIGFDGARVVWSDCIVTGPETCAVRSATADHKTTTVNPYEVGTQSAGHVQWDSAGVYWADTTGVEKYLY